jgi:hypothetical protein
MVFINVIYLPVISLLSNRRPKVANELSVKKNLIWSIFIIKSLKLMKIFAFLLARAYYKDNHMVINTC